MEHRPFETWLLNDERLTREQKSDLRLHLRECAHCAAIERSNLALRAAPVIAPSAGFALRFQARLQAQRKIERKRAVFGILLLTFAGVGLLAWLALPYLPFLLTSPGSLFTTWLQMVISISEMTRAIGIIGSTAAGILFSFVPAYIWAAVMGLSVVTSALWVISIQKLSPNLKTAYTAGGVK